VCIVLAAGLWAVWLLALGASLFLSFYAMSLAGLSLATATLAAVAGTSVAVGEYLYLRLKLAEQIYTYVKRLGKCRLDEDLSAELGVEVYKCAGWYHSATGFDFSKPCILVDSEAYSDEELKAVVYHELSHIGRRDSFMKEIISGAAKASTIVVAFQLALAAGFGELDYVAAAIATALVFTREVAILITRKKDFLLNFIASFIFFSIPLAGFLSVFLPPGPAPQIDTWDALAAALVSVGAHLALRIASHVSELLADAESALVVGPGPVFSALVKVEEVEREETKEFKRLLVESGTRLPALRYLVHRLSATHPPTSLRMRLIRLCRT